MASYDEVVEQITKVVCFYRNIAHDPGFPQEHTNCWKTFCPVHEADRQGNPSLRLFVKDNDIRPGEKELGHRCSSCSQGDIRAALQRDGFLRAVKLRPQDYDLLIPPHADIDEYVERLPIEDREASIWWEHRTLEGKTDYWLFRYNPPSGKKQFYRLFSVKEKSTGRVMFTKLNMLSKNIAPYNAWTLNKRPEAPVLIVEGYKTADAAQRMYHEYVVISFDGHETHFDWRCLTGRDVTIFPDNDKPGMQHATSIANRLPEKPKMAFLEPMPDYPEGWDLADPIPTHASIHPDVLLRDAKLYEAYLSTPDRVHDLEPQFTKYDEEIALLLNGGVYEGLVLSDLSPYQDDIKTIKLSNLKFRFPETYLDPEDEKKKDVLNYVVDMWHEQPRGNRRVCSFLTYRPDETTRFIKDGSITYINTYSGIATPAIADPNGSGEWLFNHLAKLVGKIEGDYIADYLAHMIQKPGQKPGTLIWLVGPQGAGKTIIGEIMTALLGKANGTVVDADILLDDYTSPFATKLFVMFDEVPSTKDLVSIEHRVKRLTTGRTLAFSKKYMDKAEIPSFHRIMLTSNKLPSLKLELDDRRYTILPVTPPKNLGLSEISPTRDISQNKVFLQDVMYRLSTRVIQANITKPYDTAIKEAEKTFDNPVEDFIYYMLNTGSLPKFFMDNMFQSRSDSSSNDWPGKTILLPRNALQEAFKIERRGHGLDDNKIGKEFIKHFARDGDKRDSSQRFNMVRNGVHQQIQTKTYEIHDLEKAREKFQSLVRKPIKWDPYNLEDHVDDETNVVKLRNETIL